MSETAKTITEIMKVTRPVGSDLANAKDVSYGSRALLFEKGMRGIRGQATLEVPNLGEKVVDVLKSAWQKNPGGTVAAGVGAVAIVALAIYGGDQLVKNVLLPRLKPAERIDHDAAHEVAERAPVSDETAMETAVLSAEVVPTLPAVLMTLAQWRQLVEMRLRLNQVDEELARLIASALIVDDELTALSASPELTAAEIAERIETELEAHPRAAGDLNAEELLMLFLDEPDVPNEQA